MQGTISQNSPDASGIITLRINTTLSNGAQGTLVIVLQGQQTGDDDGLSISSTQVTLGQNATTVLYQGTLTGLRTERCWRMTALLTRSGSSNQLTLQIEMQVDNSGQVSGYVQGTPTQRQSAPASPDKIQSSQQERL